MNNATINTGVHVTLLSDSGYIPKSGIAGSYGGSIFRFFFEEPLYCFP
jgi:hypothetical protein